MHPINLTCGLLICAITFSGCAHRTATGRGEFDSAKDLSHSCCSDGQASTALHPSTVAEEDRFLPVTQWLASEQRLKQLSRDMEFRNEDGDALQFGDLAGKPLAVSFIYTRCDNPNKCARVANTMAQLQNEVEKTGLGNKVHLLLITYDPEHDSPEVLKNYAVAHDLRCNQNTMMLRPDSKRKDKLFDEWQIAVNYNSAGVNIHGLQLLLFDKQGRWVRTYHTLIWDNAKVVEDLNRLASEPAFTRTSR